MVPTFAKTNGLMPVPVKLKADYGIDVEGLLATNARIIYLCTPNNPTGNALTRDSIEAVIARAPGWVIIDEAYVDFADDDFADLVKRSERVLVARTFSKAFGLAGARIGYGIGSPQLIHEIEKARGPYKLTSFGERAARAALVEDLAWVREKANLAIAERAWLAHALAERGIQCVDSQANFLFAPVAGAMRIGAAMQGRGVAVRPFANLPLIDERLAATSGEAMRITVGPRTMLETMLAALDSARSDS